MKFLVDVNLPKRFKFFDTPDFEFVADIQTDWSDTQIWQYALEQNLVILTKDSDFYSRALSTSQRPKVIQFKLGNQTLAGLHAYFSNCWGLLTELVSQHDLLLAYPDRIDIIV